MEKKEEIKKQCTKCDEAKYLNAAYNIKNFGVRDNPL